MALENGTYITFNILGGTELMLWYRNCSQAGGVSKEIGFDTYRSFKHYPASTSKPISIILLFKYSLGRGSFAPCLSHCRLLGQF